ncbi:MAG: hypothetical protein AAF399_00060 [Bacteroidota bacterium]
MPDSLPPNRFDRFSEILGWIGIVLSPTLAGVLLGGLCYLYAPGFWGIAAWVALALLGGMIGVVWANHIKQKYGTIWFLSRIMATPELDDNIGEREEEAP